MLSSRWLATLVLSGTVWCVVPHAFAEVPPRFIWQWGEPGAGPGQFMQPTGIAVDALGNVYVADSGNNRIQKFSSAGVYVTQWGGVGSGDGHFVNLIGVATDPLGNVYTLEQGMALTGDVNNRVQMFTGDGNYLRKWGVRGTTPGKFRLPTGIGVGPDGSVYVADQGNVRVQKFSSIGQYITEWSGGPSSPFNGPHAVAADGAGHVFVIDYNNHRVQRFTEAGGFLSMWGTFGDGDLQFKAPMGIATDDQGNVFVVDGTIDRIQKFDASANYLTQWGEKDTHGTGGYGTFNTAIGVAAAADGFVYVLDEGANDGTNARVQKFGPVTAAVAPPTEAATIQLAASPNPSSGRTTLQFTLPHASAATLGVYDLAGRQVASWEWPALAAGPHQVEWSGAAGPAGVMFVRMSAGGQTRTEKFVRVQ